MKRDYWNKCDVCGRFIPYGDFELRVAKRNMITPLSDVSDETWETLFGIHNTNDTVLIVRKSILETEIDARP